MFVSLTGAERAKIIAVIALSILFVIVGYFRFFHGRIGFSAKSARDSGSTVAINVPFPDIKNVPAAGQPPEQVPEPPRAGLRNIFAPLKGPAARNKLPAVVLEPPKPLPSLKLTGTIVGGQQSLAIINGRFVRIGDRIEGLQVVYITRNQVSLAGDGRKMTLNILENPDNETRGRQ